MNEKKSNNEALGRFIRDTRLSLNMSITDLAKAASMSEKTYSQYEAGITSIYVDHLVIFASVLHLDLNKLFDVYLNP